MNRVKRVQFSDENYDAIKAALEQQGYGTSAEFNMVCVSVLGFWANPRWGPTVRTLYDVYAAIFLTTHLIVLFSSFANIFVDWSNVPVLMDDINILTVCLLNSVKLWTFVARRGAMRRCLRTLRAAELAGLHDDRRRAIAGSTLFVAKAFTWGITTAGSISTCFWVLAPGLLHTFRSVEGPPGNRTLESHSTEAAGNVSASARGADAGAPAASGFKPLPTQAWLPFDFHTSPGYEVAYVLLGVGLCADTAVAATTNALYFAIMLFAVGQMRALGHSVRELRTHAARRLDSAASPTVVQLFNAEGLATPALQREMAACLKEVVLHHQAVLRYIEALQELMGPIMFCECLGLLIMLCCISFQATIVPFASFKFVSLACFLSFELGELLFFSWAGTLLIEESTAVSDAAFACSWRDCAPPFRSALRFLMLRAQKASSITALGYTTLQLKLFTTLLRASYSYYTVLRQMNSGEKSIL